MSDKHTRLTISPADIEGFVSELQGIRDHHIFPEGWDALRRGRYMGGQTKSQMVKRGPGGMGLYCPQISDADWSAAWNAIQARHQKEEIDHNLDHIEQERRDIHIDKLLEEGFRAASEYQQDRLRREINSLASHDLWKQLEDFLQEVHNVGIDAAFRRRDYGGPWSYFKYSIDCLEALLEILIAWRILVIVQPGFQTLVACVLLLVYSQVAGSGSGVPFRIGYMAADINRKFIQAFRLLRERPSKLWFIDEHEHDSIKTLNRAAVKIFIGTFKYTAITVIALAGLLRALI